MANFEVSKDVIFLGNSRKIIRSFPDSAKQRVGSQLHRLQCGLNPTDFKPMKDVGPGTYEIRVSTNQSWFRVFYVARLQDTIFVLHAFEKKRKNTSARDIQAGQHAYQEMLSLTR